MRIHQDLTFTEIGVRLFPAASRPFVTLDLGGTGSAAGVIFLDSAADCDELIRATAEARAKLLGAAGTDAP